jgi:hypothetical protein
MIIHKRLLLLTIFFFQFNARAYDPNDGDITVTLGPSLYKTIYPNTPVGINSVYRGDMGLILNGDISGKGSLEIAIFHMNKEYYKEKNNLYLIEAVQLMHISMGYRHWLNPYLSGALGLYSAYPMEQSRRVYTDFLPGDLATTSAQDKTEYGFDISVQSELRQMKYFSLIAEARYSLSMTSQTDEKADHLTWMIGMKYLFQQRNPSVIEK